MEQRYELFHLSTTDRKICANYFIYMEGFVPDFIAKLPRHPSLLLRHAETRHASLFASRFARIAGRKSLCSRQTADSLYRPDKIAAWFLFWEFGFDLE